MLNMHFKDHGWLPNGCDRAMRDFGHTVFMTAEQWRKQRTDGAGVILFDGADPGAKTGVSPGPAGGQAGGGG